MLTRPRRTVVAFEVGTHFDNICLEKWLALLRNRLYSMYSSQGCYDDRLYFFMEFKLLWQVVLNVQFRTKNDVHEFY